MVKDYIVVRFVKCFMCCGCNEISVRNWVWMKVCCNKFCDMCYIYYEVSVDFISNFMEFFKVDCMRICICFCNDKFWFMSEGFFMYVIVINILSFFIYVVFNKVILNIVEVDWIFVC